MPGNAMRVALALLFLFAASVVKAQVSGSATIVSDYCYRGVSLSHGSPEFQVDFGYDSPHGGYAGVQASGAMVDGVNTEQFVAYGGYIKRLPTRLSWEVGLSNSLFLRASNYNYTEAYIGLASDNFSGRVYFSPAYFDLKTRTMYVEINGAYALQENLHLLAHIGLLSPLSSSKASASESASRYDGRFGVSARVADWDVQLTWGTLHNTSTSLPQYEDRNPHTMVLSISYRF